jgi:hypothetical protein
VNLDYFRSAALSRLERDMKGEWPDPFLFSLKIETKNTVKLIKKMDKPQKTRYKKDMPPSKKLKTKQKYCYQQEQKLQAYNYTIPVNH